MLRKSPRTKRAPSRSPSPKREAARSSKDDGTSMLPKREGRGLPMWVCLAIYVQLSTWFPVYWHYRRHGAVSCVQAGLAFFLGLNAIVCLWEVCLFMRIDLIEKKHGGYQVEFKGRAMDVALEFFMLDVYPANVLTSKLWAEVWACYSVFDASYANRQSFGYFVDVGNGATTLLPTLVFLVGMTAHGGASTGEFDLPVSARTLGVVGLLFFWQMLYGTCVYFFSFFANKRYASLKTHEVGLFVAFTNGLWFFFPLLGLKASWELVQSDSFVVFL